MENILGHLMSYQVSLFCCCWLCYKKYFRKSHFTITVSMQSKGLFSSPMSCYIFSFLHLPEF